MKSVTRFLLKSLTLNLSRRVQDVMAIVFGSISVYLDMTTRRRRSSSLLTVSVSCLITLASSVLYQTMTPPCSMLWTRLSFGAGLSSTLNGMGDELCGPEVGGLLL